MLYYHFWDESGRIVTAGGLTWYDAKALAAMLLGEHPQDFRMLPAVPTEATECQYFGTDTSTSGARQMKFRTRSMGEVGEWRYEP